MFASRFVGAQAHPRLVSSALLPGRVNYLIGSDPRHWQVGLATFGRVRYEAVWPGIDASFSGQTGRLEYSYRVAPGADPKRIAVALEGARSVRVDRAGSLVIQVRGGSVHELAPYAYQLVGGRRRPVFSRYLVAGRTVRIALGRYNPRLPLLIDPTLAYSTYLGGSGTDVAVEVAVDSAGDAYVTGASTSGDFPTTSGAFQTTYRGGQEDAFVSKLNATGTALLYSTYLGGSGTDYGAGIAIDPAGDAYVTGHTASSDFPTTGGAFQTTLKGTADAFVTKLNPTGTGLLYSTYLGGSNGSNSGSGGIAVDSSGDAYVSGTTSSASFPTTAGAFQTTFSGTDQDAFVTKLNPTGTALVYSTYLAGSTPSNVGMEADGIAIDSAGDAYVDGYTKMTDFPTTAGAFQTTLNGTTNAFVTKLNPAGSALVYSTYLGGSGKDAAFRVAVDSSGDAYVTGGATSTNFPTTAGAFQTTLKGASNAFVTKLNPAGTALVYSTYLGGSGSASSCTKASLSSCEGGIDIALDSVGDAYVTGATDSSDFPTTPGAYQTTYGGGTDAFVTEFNPAGAGLVYSTYLGGSGLDVGAGIAVDSSGDIYVTGGTESTNFPTTTGPFQTTLNGTTDAFVTKMGPPSGAMHPTSTSVACSPETVDAGESTTCTATVHDTNAGGQTTPTGTIMFTTTGPGSFSNSGSCALTAVNASSARCSVTYTPGAPATTTRTDTITATYGSDSTHAGSHGSTQVTIVLASVLAHGAFVIGDQEAAVGNTVTFWGAQWASLNPLSGGSAPASFKGFVGNTANNPPQCGDRWTTSPGNSSSPPSSVPGYMEVIVASSISKAGSDISGNTVEVVVVKTDAGYAPDPGHRGTGTVVGIVCHS